MSKQNYMTTLNEFWESAQGKLSPDEGYLYLYLIQKFNRNFWENPIKITVTVVLKDLYMDRRAFYHAKDRLVELGLIEYKAVSGRFATSEFIIKTDFNLCKIAQVKTAQPRQKCIGKKKVNIDKIAYDKSSNLDNSAYNSENNLDKIAYVESSNIDKIAYVEPKTPLDINKTIIKENINKQDINKQDIAETEVSDSEIPTIKDSLTVQIPTVAKNATVQNELLGNSEQLEEFQISNNSDTQTFTPKGQKNQTQTNTSAPRKKTDGDQPAPDPLNAALIAAYVDFCKKEGITLSYRVTNRKKKINGIETVTEHKEILGVETVKEIMNPYLRQWARDNKTEKGWQFGANEDDSALGCFKRALERYENWNDFYRQQTQLLQLSKFLPNIINYLISLNSGKPNTIPNRTNGNGVANNGKPNLDLEIARTMRDDMVALPIENFANIYTENDVTRIAAGVGITLQRR